MFYTSGACVHSRLYNAYYEVKFKKHPIHLQHVHELSYKEEKKIFLIFQKKSLLIKWSVCFQASKAVFIFSLAIIILFFIRIYLANLDLQFFKLKNHEKFELANCIFKIRLP
jgi:hypothetical protein